MTEGNTWDFLATHLVCMWCGESLEPHIVESKITSSGEDEALSLRVWCKNAPSEAWIHFTTHEGETSARFEIVEVTS